MKFVFLMVLFGLTVVLTTVWAKIGYQGSVEKALVEEGAVILKEAGFTGVELAFDHLDAKLSGTVDHEGDKEKILALLAAKLPAARLPEHAESGLVIRPTLKPWVGVSRESKGAPLMVTGRIAALEEANRELLGARLLGVAGVANIENQIILDPMRLPFPQMAELASLVAGLLPHSDGVKVICQDGRLVLEGRLPNAGMKASLLELAASIAAVSLEDRIVVESIAAPLPSSELKITRNRFGFTLTGVLASAEIKSKLLELIRSSDPAARMTERIEVLSSGAVASWEANFSALIPTLLSNLAGELTAEFGPEQIRLIGEAKDETTKTDVLRAFLVLKETQPSLEILSEIKSGSTMPAADGPTILVVLKGGKMTLDGVVPQEDFVAPLVELLKKSAPGIEIVADFQVSDKHSTQAWLNRLGDIVIEMLLRTEESMLSVEKGAVTLTGIAKESTGRQILNNAMLNTLPPDYTMANELTIAGQPLPGEGPSPEARGILVGNLAAVPVYFASNSDIIDDENRDEVAKIAELLAGLPDGETCIITGFADNVGNAEYNEALSLRRAASVRAQLASLGVAAERLSTKSQIDDVSSIPKSERWKSRRVEVTIGGTTASPAPGSESAPR
jgi:outer membrane protein OmpA-like peptidoglycan-associated protein